MQKQPCLLPVSLYRALGQPPHFGDIDEGESGEVLEVDQFGKSPINEIIMSRDAKVKVPLAETTLANLVATMPGATLITSTTSKAVVQHGIGINLLDIARTLILHPVANAVSNRADDFALFLSMCAGALQFAYKLDQERIYPVEFSGYPSSATKNLFGVGDQMISGLAVTIDATADTGSATGHGLVTGQPVLMDAAVFPTNTISLCYGMTLFVNKIDADTG